MNRVLVFIFGLIAGAIGLAAIAVLWVNLRRPPVPRQFANAALDRLPFAGEWFVVWGGETRRDNHHHDVSPQNLAMDIVRTLPGSTATYQGERRRNESYACWSQPIVAPVDGTVVLAVDGIPDNVPGEMNPHMVSGNCLMLRADAGFVVVLCHFKSGSVARKAGERVKAGDLLGLCGNSGNSSEPHLHFQVQSEPGFVKGVALRPVFRAINVGGAAKENYSPRKGDRIAPPGNQG